MLVMKQKYVLRQALRSLPSSVLVDGHSGKHVNLSWELCADCMQGEQG